MAVDHVLARVRRVGFADLPLAGLVEQACGDLGHEWRDRLLTPLVTVRLFVLQVLHGNTAITHLRHLAGFAFSAGSYCEARGRLPLEVLQGVLGRMASWAGEVAAAGLPPLLGRRVLVVDGSTCSMPDAPALRAVRPAVRPEARRRLPDGPGHGAARRGDRDVRRTAGPAAVHARHARGGGRAPVPAGRGRPARRPGVLLVRPPRPAGRPGRRRVLPPPPAAQGPRRRACSGGGSRRTRRPG